ncbi:MAG TPA: DUF481 domain-containing protein [Armatimonadota bacterium]|nr:DUF481 domain-containing protein [Armatimonadota bacterium]HOJ20069.1 DUF481 domain-containing protein [Armatimonadota bacterium]HOM81228.1 DUF481 domain-containing protein [Armatimonadota bacterium]HPO73591.1 DUF481 domain-containing protein [Armatimonadota bacterium]
MQRWRERSRCSWVMGMRRAARLWVPLLLALAPAGSLRADELVFGEQERLKGRVVKMADGQLLLRSEAAGEVRVPWASITDLHTMEPLAVQTRDGRRLVGVLEGMQEGKLRLATDEGMQLVEASLVTWIGPEEETPSAPPAPPKVQWTGNVELGLGLLAGNSRRQDYHFGTEIRRRTRVDRWHLTASAHHGESQGNTDISRAALGLTYSRNLWGRHYYSTGAFLNHDDMKRLRLGGYYFLSKGYRLIDRAPNRWDLEIGGTYVNDNFRYQQRDSFNGLVRSITEVRVFGGSTLKAVWMIWPSLDAIRHVRGTATVSLDVPIARKASLRIGIAEEYDSRPPANTQPHDFQSTMSLVYRL